MHPCPSLSPVFSHPKIADDKSAAQVFPGRTFCLLRWVPFPELGDLYRLYLSVYHPLGVGDHQLQLILIQMPCQGQQLLQLPILLSFVLGK